MRNPDGGIRDLAMADSLQHQTTTQCTGLPPTCARGHHLDGAKTDHALTFNSEHSSGTVQLQLTIDAIHALVVPAETFDIAQMQKAHAKAPGLFGICQCHQPICDQLILIRQFGLVSIAYLADAERPARQNNAGGLIAYSPFGHLFALRRPHHLFPSASFRRSFCMLFSAYIFFSRLFSSSCSFIRTIRWRPCSQVLIATCRNSHCSCPVRSTSQQQEHHSQPP